VPSETLIFSPAADSLSAGQQVAVAFPKTVRVEACEKGGPSPEELVLFFDQSADLLCIATFAGYFLHLNNRWHELLGYSNEELRSRPLLEFIHPEDRAVLHRESLLSATGPLLKERFDLRFLHQAGHYRWLQWSMRSDPDQKLIFVSARDVTETKEARTYFQVVVEAAPAGLMIVNKEGRIVLVNRQIEAQFGYQREELNGKTVETLVPERYRGGHKGSLHDFLVAPTTRSMGAGRDLFGLRRDGTEFPVEIALNPFRTGETQFVLCTVVDITNRKTQELELKNRVQELQRHRAEMDTLSQMSSLLQHAVDPEEVHAIVAGYSAQLFQDKRVAIYNLPPSANYLRLSTAWGGATTDRKSYDRTTVGHSADRARTIAPRPLFRFVRTRIRRICSIQFAFPWRRTVN
jgi:PAS domain S-box-containing protein